jgi:D-alanyl-D-alanine dipeptidase
VPDIGVRDVVGWGVPGGPVGGQLWRRLAIGVLGVFLAGGLAACSAAAVSAAPSSPAAVPSTVAPTTVAPTPTLTPTPSREPRPDILAPAGIVALSDVDPTILQDMRYATNHNFEGRVVHGYVEPLCILNAPTAAALHKVQVAANARGYSLKVYDCYRPQRAVNDFIAWAKNLTDTVTKAEFYPTVDKSNLFRDGYIGAPTPHSSGSTVDLTLVKMPAAPQRAYVLGEPQIPCMAPAAQRFPDNSIDMGTGFDCFDPRAHTLDSRITGVQHDNRLLLKSLMSAVGFVNYSGEWWHYTLGGTAFAGKYFNFPVQLNALPGHQGT